MAQFPNGYPGGHDSGEILGPAQLPPNVAEFANRVGQLNGLHPRLIQEVSDVAIDHSGVIDKVLYSDALRDLDHAHFNGDIIAAMGETERPHFDFAWKRGWSLGRQDSQHAAFFGVLSVSGGPGEEQQEIPVVVKEFPFTPPVASKAVQEYMLLKDLRARGLPAVEPIGLITHRWHDGGPSVYLLVRMEPDLESLNSQDWTDIQPGELLERISPIPDTLAILHGEGIFNRELAFGNAGVGEEEGSRYIFDLESSVSMRAILDNLGSDDPIPAELLIMLRQEFTPPRQSLKEIVYPNLPADARPESPEDHFQMEYMLLYEPYEVALAASSSPYAPVLLRAYRTVLAQLRSEAHEASQKRES